MAILPCHSRACLKWVSCTRALNLPTVTGHGVTGSHLFGQILSDAINGNTAEFDRFKAIPWIPFPGGRTFRVPYFVVGSWWYALRDRFGF